MQGMRSAEWDDDRGTVLGRAVRLLTAFDSDRPELPVAELARRAGLPKSTAHRLVGEWCGLGILERTGGGVRLGLRLFELGQLVPRQRGLREAAQPYLHDLQVATGCTVHLVVLEGVEVVYVEIMRSRGAPLLPARVGGRLPAHVTGVGKAILAYSPAAVVQERIDAGLVARTPRTITTPGRLTQELHAVRQQGVAFDREESGIGIACVAAPIFGAEETVCGALSVTGRTIDLDLPRMAPAVRTAALSLSRALGSRRAARA